MSSPSGPALDLEDLDRWDGPGAGIRFYSNLAWDGPGPGGRPIRHVGPRRGSAAGARLPGVGPALRLAADLAQALALAAAARGGATGVLEVDRAVVLYCLFRRLLRRSRPPVLLFGLYLEPLPGRRRALLRQAVLGATRTAVWSRRQVEAYARALELPPAAFVHLPYKSNHSQDEEPARPLGNVVFSGGNSERDYRTLFRAVDGLETTVVVSTTDPATLGGLDPPANVIVVRAVEPHYRRLMAGSRLVVVPLTPGRLRGAGEASILNAMWHGVPVVCADDVSAPDYIADGVDGRVVPPGDAAALRGAITGILADPGGARRMGEAGRAKVRSGFTHARWRERLFKLAALGAGAPPPAGGRAG